MIASVWNSSKTSFFQIRQNVVLKKFQAGNKIKLYIFLAMLLFANSTLLTPKKLCINCKHFIADRKECAIFGETDLVTGEIDYSFASSARSNDKKCGEDAMYFVENEYKFITIPYYFSKTWWPIYISLIIIFLSIFLNYTGIGEMSIGPIPAESARTKF